GARYRLGRLTTKAAQERAEGHYDFIEELVDVAIGRLDLEAASHPVQLLLSVRHPAWSYGHTGEGEVDRTTWLVTLADSLGLDPVGTFGFSKALTNRHRKRALEAGVTDGTDVRQTLTSIGTQTG